MTVTASNSFGAARFFGLGARVMQKLGVSTQLLAGGDIFPALEKGVIDGQENPLWVMEVYKFYEIQDHMTLTRHVYSPHIDVASLAWWKKLSVPLQSSTMRPSRGRKKALPMPVSA